VPRAEARSPAPGAPTSRKNPGRMGRFGRSWAMAQLQAPLPVRRLGPQPRSRAPPPRANLIADSCPLAFLLLMSDTDKVRSGRSPHSIADHSRILPLGSRVKFVHAAEPDTAIESS